MTTPTVPRPPPSWSETYKGEMVKIRKEIQPMMAAWGVVHLIVLILAVVMGLKIHLPTAFIVTSMAGLSLLFVQLVLYALRAVRASRTQKTTTLAEHDKWWLR